jgi:branched-chain amino acid transport system substrate-binding protein
MRKKVYIYLLIVVVATLTAVLLGCASGTTEEDIIKIGFIGNLSEPFSISAEAAAKLAVDEFTEAGGILGKKVILLIEDTKGEIPIAQEAYKKLVMEDRVLAVLVGEKAEMGLAAIEVGAELFPELPHIFINTIGSHDDIWRKVRDDYDKYKFAFQTYYFTSSGYLTINGKEIMPTFYESVIGAKKVALIYEDMAWTEPLRVGLQGVSPRLAGVYESKGLEVVYETTVSLDQKMFTVDLEKAAAANAEVIDCVIGYIDEEALIKQWAESSASHIPLYIWGGFAGMPAAWSATEGKVEGVMIGSSQVKQPITEKTVPFMENLEKQYGVGPIFGSHTTYDSLYGFKKAVEEVGSMEDVESIIKQMETIEEVAVLGTIGWDAENHYNLPYPKYITPIVQWQDEAMEIVFPLDIATKRYMPPNDLRK